MSTARVRLKFGEVLIEEFCAGAANVIFRHASTSTGVWVKEVRTRVREYVREYVRARKREKFVDPTLVDTKAGNIN
jgi:hypothetical protein